MKAKVKEFESMFMKKDMPEFEPGDTIAVMFRVREGDKERLQSFQGVVIQVRGTGISRSLTLRKMSGNVAVERIFPLHSPAVESIQRIRKGSVRRARLNYLKKLIGKAAKIKEERAQFAELIPQEPAAEAAAPSAESPTPASSKQGEPAKAGAA